MRSLEQDLYINMKFNCHKIIVSFFKVNEALIAPYYDHLRNQIISRVPQIENQERLKLVNEQNFVAQVLEDSKNVGICYTHAGILESSQLNQQKGVRAALVHNKYIAQMCRKHNDANICVLGVDFLGIKQCTDLVIHYLQSEFDNEERNMLRIAMLMDFEKQPPTAAKQ